MGELQGTLFSPEYNRSIQVEARPEKVSGDAGALLMREVMERLGYGRLFEKYLTDPRNPSQVTHPQADLLRTALVQGLERVQDDDVAALHVVHPRPDGVAPLGFDCAP